jgi:hypothetical protein
MAIYDFFRSIILRWVAVEHCDHVAPGGKNVLLFYLALATKMFYCSIWPLATKMFYCSIWPLAI